MKVLLTDHPWPDVAIEQSICEHAGHELIAGPIEALPREAIDSFIEREQPHAIMCCWAPVSERAIRSVSDLRVVARLGVGLDNIAIDAANAAGAWVTNVPDYCIEEVSDHAVSMLLAHWRGVVAFDREAKRGHWNPASARLIRTRDKVVGIIGFGRIGQASARKIASGFGARVLAYSPSLLRNHAEGAQVAAGVWAASIATIQREANAILLHLPLSVSNRNMVSDGFIAACRRRPFLINVSRGGLVDNDALIRALDSGALSGAGLDVVEGEPSPPPAVIAREDVIVTPHIAFTSDAALEELRTRCTTDVVRVLRGERPLHPCNSPVGAH